MSRMFFGFPNLIDAAALSGGSWTNGALANIQTRYYRQYAISADLDTSSSRAVIALAKSYRVRVVAIPAGAHNLTANARWRIEASDTPDFSVLVYDSGEIACWVSPEDSQADWEAEGDYGLYRPSDADLGFRPWCLAHCIPAGAPGEGIQARYWRLTFSDGGNPDGVVMLGRVFIGGGFVSEVNFSYGAGLGIETDSAVDLASSGHESFRRKEPYRVLRFQLDHMPQGQAMSRHLEMMQRAGLDREVMAVLDPEAVRDVQHRCFVGRLRRLSAVELASFRRWSTGYEIKEIQ